MSTPQYNFTIFFFTTVSTQPQTLLSFGMSEPDSTILGHGTSPFKRFEDRKLSLPLFVCLTFLHQYPIRGQFIQTTIFYRSPQHNGCVYKWRTNILQFISVFKTFTNISKSRKSCFILWLTSLYKYIFFYISNCYQKWTLK